MLHIQFIVLIIVERKVIITVPFVSTQVTVKSTIENVIACKNTLYGTLGNLKY